MLNRKQLLPLAVLCLSCSPWCTAEEEKKPADPEYKGLPVLQVKVAEKAPDVDGKLDDEVWKSASKAMLKQNDGTAAKDAHATELRVLTTKDALFLAVRCKDSKMATVKGNKQDRDSDEIWQEDAIEFFFTPGNSEDAAYHQIVVNAGNSIYDGFNRETSWNGAGIKSAIGKEEAAWTLELCVPFADLKFPEKKEELLKGCRMNIYRGRPTRPEGDAAEDYGWSPTGGGSNHTPSRFGYVFLEAFGAKIPPPEAKTEAAPAEKKTQ